VTRVATQTQDLTYMQVRNAFDRTATLAELARKFRADRIQALKTRKIWCPLKNGPHWVVHLIPVAAMTGQRIVDVRAINQNGFAQFSRSEWRGASRTMNLEGIASHPGANADGTLATYVQVFRTGSLESVRYAFAVAGAVTAIPATVGSAFIRETTQKMLSAARTFGLTGPAIHAVSLIDCAGFEFSYVNHDGISISQPIRHPDIDLPETWIDALEVDLSIDELVRPTLDILWQCFDVERCLDFDPAGRWIR
jgi:hypothetical protein